VGGRGAPREGTPAGRLGAPAVTMAGVLVVAGGVAAGTGGAAPAVTATSTRRATSAPSGARFVADMLWRAGAVDVVLVDAG
jgi:hypothetical protein